MRSGFRWLGLGLLLAGCQSPPTKLPEQIELEQKKRQEQTKTEERAVRSEGGETTVSNPETREPVWRVQWKTADLDYSLGDGKVGGRMRGITGEMFRAGKLANRFEANEAQVVRGSRVLSLSGGVKIRAVDQGGRLEADSAVYEADAGVIKAKGEIAAELQGYLLGGVKEVWASADLTTVATPDMFPVSAKRKPVSK